MRVSEAARYLGLARSTYYQHAAEGRVPKPILIAGRAVGVPLPELERVIAAGIAARAERAA